MDVYRQEEECLCVSVIFLCSCARVFRGDGRVRNISHRVDGNDRGLFSPTSSMIMMMTVAGV